MASRRHHFMFNLNRHHIHISDMQRWDLIYAYARRKIPDVLSYELSHYAVVDPNMTMLEACEAKRVDIVAAIDFDIASEYDRRRVLDRIAKVLGTVLEYTDINLFEIAYRKISEDDWCDDVVISKLQYRALETNQIERARLMQHAQDYTYVLYVAIPKNDVTVCERALEFVTGAELDRFEGYHNVDDMLSRGSVAMVDWYIRRMVMRQGVPARAELYRGHNAAVDFIAHVRELGRLDYMQLAISALMPLDAKTRSAIIESFMIFLGYSLRKKSGKIDIQRAKIVRWYFDHFMPNNTLVSGTETNMTLVYHMRDNVQQYADIVSIVNGDICIN